MQEQFNLMDFSGIGLEESQFMDQSNANINNVFGSEQIKPNPDPVNAALDEQILNTNNVNSNGANLNIKSNNQVLDQEKTAHKMMGLADINLGEMGLDDMSRISMGNVESNMNNDHVSEPAQNPPSSSQKIEQQHVEVHNKPEPAQPQPAKAASTEWKKPTFQKKRKNFGSKKEQSSTALTQKHAIPSQPEKQFEKSQDLKSNVVPARPNHLYTSNVKRQEMLENKQAGRKSPDTPEPLPLFDCIFCVGIHEHLVTQTVKERNLRNIYGERHDRDYGKNVNQTLIKDQFEDFYEECDDLQRLFTVNLLQYQNVGSNQSFEKSEEEDEAQFQIPNLSQGLRKLKSLSTIQQEYRPLKNTIEQLNQQIKKKQLQQKKAVEQIQNQKTPIETAKRLNDSVNSQVSASHEDMMVSNILGEFDDIDPEEQSMFMKLNIRNRRQKILHKLSFETEVFDIYDPIYTSDEESGSNSETSSASSSASSLEEEQSSYGSQQSISDGNMRQLSSDQVLMQTNPDSIELDQDLKQHAVNNQGKKSDSQLNEQDLDYNSEYNRSSLSSIHREIHEPSEKLVSGESKSNQKSEQKDQNLVSLVDEGEELGGCLVEDMQDDTVMNKCKSMFKQDAGRAGGEKSFQNQLNEPKHAQLTNQLKALHQNYIVLESVNMDDSKIHESFNINQAPRKKEQLVSTTKKENQKLSQFQTTSDKRKRGKNAIEDDSIIRILPGLPNGIKTRATAIEEVDLKDNSNSAIGGELSPVIKVEKSAKQRKGNKNQQQIQIKLEKLEPITTENEIQIHDLEQGNPMLVPQKVNIMTDQSSSANLSDLDDKFKKQSEEASVNHMVSCKPNELQIVDSGSELSTDDLMIGLQKSSHRARVVQENAVQRSNPRVMPASNIQQVTGIRRRPRAQKKETQDLKQKEPVSRKINFYDKIEQKNLIEARKASNLSRKSGSRSKSRSRKSKQVSKRTSMINGIVSMGTLPTFQQALNDQGIIRSGSTNMLEEANDEVIEQKTQPLKNNYTENQEGNKNAEVDASDSNQLPLKSEISLDNASKIALTAKKYQKTRVTTISKKDTVPLKQNYLQKNMTKDKKGQTMLSRDQIKLMRQLEKQQKKTPVPTVNKKKIQMTQDANINRKNVIENYFKIGGHTIDQNAATIEQADNINFDEIEDLAFLKKRSVTNMNVREKSQDTKGRERSQQRRISANQRNDKSGSRPAKSKNLRSSSIEMNIYSKTQAIQNVHTSKKKEDHKLSLQRKNSTSSNSKLVHKQKNVPNLDLNKLDKIAPEILQNNQQAQSQRKQLNKIQQNIQKESYKNLQQMKYQSQVESMPQTKRFQPQNLQSKHIKHTQKSLLHSSTSQLEQFSLSGIALNQQQSINKQNLALSKITDVVQVDETEIMMPAHSHRGFSKQKLLSISADKNSGGQAMELMKSTINMQPNLSLIQSKINQNNQTNNNQVSKASIERDINYLKINTDQVQRKPTKTLMQMTSNQKNRTKNVNFFKDEQCQLTAPDTAKMKDESKKKKPIQTQVRRAKDSMPNFNQINKPKKVHHSQKTSIAMINSKQEIGSTTSNKQLDGSDVLSPNKQSSKNSFSSNKQRSGLLSQVQENYKKLILENAKILQFNSNLINAQTPTDSQQRMDMSLPADSLKQNQITTKNTSWINNSNLSPQNNNSQSYHLQPMSKTRSHQVEAMPSEEIQPALLKFSSMQGQKPQVMKQNQVKGDNLANFSSLPLQIKNKNEGNPSMYYASQAVGSKEHSKKRDKSKTVDENSKQPSKQVSLNLAQMQGGAMQIQPLSNSAAKNKDIKLKPQKSSGSNQQSISQIAGGQPMGQTTFLQGNANTTASSNTLLLNNKSQFGQKSLLNLQNTNMIPMSNMNVTSTSNLENTHKISTLLQKTQKVAKRFQKEENQLDKSAPNSKKMYQKHHSQYDDKFEL